MRKAPSVCTGKTPARSTHAGVFRVHTEASWTHTRRRFESTHGGFSTFSVFLALCLLSVCLSFCLSFFLSVCHSVSSPLLSSLLSSLFLSSRSCRLSFLSATMTMITRPARLSLCTHGSNLPVCRSACALAHFLSGEHVRIMHETTVLA